MHRQTRSQLAGSFRCLPPVGVNDGWKTPETECGKEVRAARFWRGCKERSSQGRCCRYTASRCHAPSGFTFVQHAATGGIGIQFSAQPLHAVGFRCNIHRISMHHHKRLPGQPRDNRQYPGGRPSAIRLHERSGGLSSVPTTVIKLSAMPALIAAQAPGQRLAADAGKPTPPTITTP